MIWRHKIILATILGIMLIPFLYSVFFLKSVWDPYGNVDKLPVAVVNNDRPVEFRGQKLNVGQQLVNNMKKQSGLDWHFVTEKRAQDGMAHHKYYMVVKIPDDFSQNAGTVLDEHPRKMNLQYQTNDSLNYIGQVITKEAAGELNSKVSRTVSTAYADTMFGVVKQVGTGFGKAAKGAVKLNDGSKALTNGLTTYTAGVKTLNNGVITLHSGVEPLSAGIVQLADGSLALDRGLRTYTGAVSQVNSGVQTLQAGASPLAQGVSQLNGGAQTLNSGVQQYTGAVSQLNGGLQQLAGSTDKLAGVAQQLQSLPYRVAGTYVLGQQVSYAVKEQIVPTLNKFSSMLTPENKQELQNLQNTTVAMKSQLDGFGTIMKSLAGNLQKIGANDKESGEQAGAALLKIKEMPVEDHQKLQSAGVIAALTTTVKNAQENGETLNDINQSTGGFQTTLTKAKTQLDAAQKQLTELNTLIASLESGGDSSNSVAQLAAVATQLQTATVKLNGSVNGTSQNTFKPAASGQQLEAQIAAITKNSQFNAVIPGLTQYMNGVKTAANGAQKLNQHGTQLRSGAGQLSNGLNMMNGQVPTLVGGINTLANGTSQLASNGGLLVSGSSTLAGGLGQLNGQVPLLVNGLDTLANGAAQLAGNSDKLNSASDQVAAGTGTLAQNLQDGAHEVNSTNLKKQNAQMFAAPTKLAHSNYSKVPNYGFALAPYMLSVALYVGALVFNLVYPLRKMGSDESTATEWFGSKVIIGGLVAIGNALVELLLMMAVGLHPQNVGGFLLNGITFSLAAMYIVMFLAVALDNPGRFIGMILLVIQLGASGGSFPIEITTGMHGFFQAINPFLPMTYSVYGFREALTGGFGSGQIMTSFGIMLIFIAVSLILLWAVMQLLHNRVTYEPGPSSVVQESGNGSENE